MHMYVRHLVGSVAYVGLKPIQSHQKGKWRLCSANAFVGQQLRQCTSALQDMCLTGVLVWIRFLPVLRLSFKLKRFFLKLLLAGRCLYYPSAGAWKVDNPTNCFPAFCTVRDYDALKADSVEASQDCEGFQSLNSVWCFPVADLFSKKCFEVSS